jgi:hypothetical protein
MRLQASPQPFPPRRDVLDDEEVLARVHVSKRARFARDRGDGGRRAEPALEVRLLVLEAADDGATLAELSARVDVRLQRAVVEKRDEHERPDGEPAAEGHPAEEHQHAFVSCRTGPARTDR